jgi:hypothetical protein
MVLPLVVGVVDGGLRQDTDGPWGGKLLVGQQGVPIDEIVGWWRRVDGSFSGQPRLSGVSAESRVRPATTWGAQSGLR